jgi:hypothetical protein
MSRIYAALFALAAAAGFGAAPGPADAQFLDPRAGQALAICNSPMGAGLKECAQLRGALGGAAQPQGFPGAGNATAAQLAYAACVQRAGINQAAIQACNAQLNATLGLPNPAMGAGAYNPTNTAMAIHQNAQAYQRCIAGLGGTAGGINPCTPLLNGAPAGPGAPAGFGAPGANPPAPYNPPAPSAPPLDPLAPPNKPFDPLGL